MSLAGTKTGSRITVRSDSCHRPVSVGPQSSNAPDSHFITLGEAYEEAIPSCSQRRTKHVLLLRHPAQADAKPRVNGAGCTAGLPERHLHDTDLQPPDFAVHRPTLRR